MLLDLLDVQHDYQSVDPSNNVQQLDPGAVRPEVSKFFECFCELNVSCNELPDQLIDRPQLSSSPRRISRYGTAVAGIPQAEAVCVIDLN